MKRFAFILLGFSFFIFLISLIWLFWGRVPIQTETFYASAEVGEGMGFDLNSSALSFGKIQAPGSSTRKINFQNGYSFPIIAVIKANGEIKNLMHFDEIVEIDKGEIRAIPFSISSSDADNGFYEGNVTFEIYRR